MKNLHNAEEATKTEEIVSELSKKKDVNIQSHTTLYFQIGLILCLLGTYALFEMNFQTSLKSYGMMAPIVEPDFFYMPEPKTDPVKTVEKKQPRTKVVVLSSKAPVIKKDDDLIDPIELVMPESLPQVATGDPKTKAPVITDLGTDTPFSMIGVEKVPIFPGCELARTNAERMSCMSEKLTKLIQKKFNTDLAAELGLEGLQKIQVQFTIDNTGHVTNIKTRSPYEQLEKEASRVVSSFPTMKPGMQRDIPVSVVYNLPIVFQVK